VKIVVEVGPQRLAWIAVVEVVREIKLEVDHIRCPIGIVMLDGWKTISVRTGRPPDRLGCAARRRVAS
jgi:hypothetical protein